MSYKKLVRRPTPSAKAKSDLEKKLRQLRKIRTGAIARGEATFFGAGLKFVASPLAMDEYADFC